MVVWAKVCDLTEDLLWFVCGLYLGILMSGAKVCDLTEDLLWFVFGNFDVWG